MEGGNKITSYAKRLRKKRILFIVFLQYTITIQVCFRDRTSCGEKEDC